MSRLRAGLNALVSGGHVLQMAGTCSGCQRTPPKGPLDLSVSSSSRSSSLRVLFFQEFFDYVFSYAALLHLDFSEQCRVAHELVKKLRLQGKAFLGWNRAHRVSPWSWLTCFDRTKIHLHGTSIEILEEAQLFPRDAQLSRGNFLWDFPSYSVFLTRVA